MAERKIKKWVTFRGRHIPIYEDGDIEEAIQNYLKDDKNKGPFKSTSQSDVREPNKEDQIAKAKEVADKLNGKVSKFNPLKASDEYTNEYIHNNFSDFVEGCLYELEDAKEKNPNYAGAKEYINSLLKNSRFDFNDVREIIDKGTVGGYELYATKNGKEIDISPRTFMLDNGLLHFKSRDTASGWISEKYLDL